MIVRRTLLLLLMLCFGAFAGDAVQGEEQRPFVIGFERFGRHDDISKRDAGSLLISELNCAACHATDDPLLAAKRGPKLSGAGNRLRGQWVRRFVTNPQQLHGGTTMPNVLHGLDERVREEAASDLVAFLASQQQSFPTLKAGGALPVVHEFWRKGDSARGRELYHTIGCVACHEPDPDYEAPSSVPSPIDALIEQLEPEELEEMGLARAARRVESIPHGDLRQKYSLRALTMMLLDPSSVRPDARMPALRLQPSEAADLAAYLMDEQPLEIDLGTKDIAASQIEAGRRWFEQLRCVNCHDSQLKSSQTMARPLAELNVTATSSCLNQPSGNMASYDLDAEQQEAIISTLRDGVGGDRNLDRQIVEQRLLQLNCYACHERRQQDDEVLGGVGRFRKPYFETFGHIDLGDEGRLPPPLSDVGRKLLPGALESVFTAKATPRRPFMTIRMPAYHPTAVADLVKRLPLVDQADAANETEVFGNTAELAEIGRELVNTGCVECHVFRGESLPGAIGVDVHDISKRVHPQWFLEFLRNPGELKPRTRMPTFFPEGKSNRKDLLDGDVDRQVAAIWHYLKQSDPLPEKISEARSRDFELSPSERPVILRTFMRQAGNHAVAVGYPGGLNLAFDAEQVGLAMIWKGRFLDARGTWFERFAPSAEPLGDAVIVMASQPTVMTDIPSASTPASKPQTAETSSPKSPTLQFGGYRIDAAGMPTFLYRFGPWEFEDRIEPGENQSLLRTWRIKRSQPRSAGDNESSISLRVHSGKQLDRIEPKSVRDEQGLVVSLREGNGERARVLQSANRQDWLIQLEEQAEQVIKVEYRW